jgi:phosphatidylserine/phosphatidylglycerophosphate/cardiolipin synthase-like enzyme
VVASVFRLTTLAFIERLLNAASRGVHVEVLLNGGNRCVRKAGCPSTAVKLLARLNRMSDPRSWLRTCDGGTPANHEVATSNGDGCIGQTLDHNKFFAFSATSLTEGGTPEPLVLQTSTNNTTSQYRHAWNDALLLGGQSAVYQDYLRYFRDMVHAASSSAPTRAMYFTRRSGTTVDTTTVARRDIETWSFPRAPSDDPVADVLHRVPTARRCANRVAPGDAGPGRSHVYAAVAYINGRPLLIRQLVRLQESGCVVQVIYTTISPQDRSELTAAGVQLYQACTPADSQDDETRQYLHSKFFLVDGSDTSVGSNRRLVYTGSENWNSQSLSSADNRMMRYVEPATPKASTSTSSPLFDDYMSRWQELQAAVEANGQPTADTCHGATDY